ncbi:MAG TPA: phage major capsid protein [Porphyromonadaceae bacterium]|nr:phage major capsid protein [Porphyromonadaceae bacterium]
MKKKLLALMAKKEARKQELATKANATEDIKELRGINTELEALNGEIAEFRSMIDAIPDEPPAGTTPAGVATPQPLDNQRGAAVPPVGIAQILATYGVGPGQLPAAQRTAEPEDKFATLEYRRAFMDFMKTGKMTPEFRSMQPEFRADAMTTVSEVSAVVPTTILNEIIKKAEVYGQIFRRIRSLNVPGGLTIPILSLKPTATRITEAGVSDKKKVTANTSVSFSYYGLECKVSISLLAQTVTLSGFENTVVDLIGEAMIKALEGEIISGTGVGECLGMTVDPRVPVAQIVTLASADFVDWSGWKQKVFAKMPLAYKAGAAFLMASGTFEGYIDGMIDANGQPIGRINYGIVDGPQERFGGKEVIQVEDDIIAPYDDANVGDVVAVYCNLRNYGVNSNLQMMMFRYFDHDTNEWVDKAILIADGKLIDPNGVVIIKKGA